MPTSEGRAMRDAVPAHGGVARKPGDFEGGRQPVQSPFRPKVRVLPDFAGHFMASIPGTLLPAAPPEGGQGHQ